MAIKKFKPTTSTSRWKTVLDTSDITKKKPEKSLTVPTKKKGGRNNLGRITARGRGGGHKRKYRIIDFARRIENKVARVESIEYDPNRSARIALINYEDGKKSYIVAPTQLKVGDHVVSGENAEIRPGNTLSLSKIPTGVPVYNIEFSPGCGAKIARAAGTYCIITAKEGGFALIRMPSGELRKINEKCKATIGQVSCIDHENISLGKAGRSRYLGRVPLSRGVAKNPVDHPMGGGEGKSSGGRHPCSAKGLAAKGLKTRKKKGSDKFIVKRRNQKK